MGNIIIEGINYLLLLGVNVLMYISNSIPEEYRYYFAIIFTIFVVTIYSLFVWKFYQFIATRDVFELNLSQYNKVEHDAFNKLVSFFLFILEYMIIVPIIVFFWFFIVALMIFFLGKELETANILLISGGIVGAIRITAYYKEELSKELSKLFPLTILAIAVVTPGFFNAEEIINKIGQIGNLFANVVFYLIVIVFIEFFLRMIYLISERNGE